MYFLLLLPSPIIPNVSPVLRFRREEGESKASIPMSVNTTINHRVVLAKIKNLNIINFFTINEYQ